MSAVTSEESLDTVSQSMDFVVFSHLRWNFVYQRPQQILVRCARANRVFFIEEPIVEETGQSRLEVSRSEEGVVIVVPVLPAAADQSQDAVISRLLENFFKKHKVVDPVLWYYTPMAMNFTASLSGSLVVYDCMDELSAFRGAPPGLQAAEASLLQRADLVFTGGRSLHEAKRRSHPSVHLFPSSIDVQHFGRARSPQPERVDQASLDWPRLGYCGVIDERMDLALLSEVAAMRPMWQFVMLGPVVKINEADLPRRPNIHYLGMKTYKDLPAYLAGWDIAMLPFALNESTRFISPTKTPEYLAAGLPTISTSVRDVVSPYGEAANHLDFYSGRSVSIRRSRARQHRGRCPHVCGCCGTFIEPVWIRSISVARASGRISVGALVGSHVVCHVGTDSKRPPGAY